MPNDLRKTTENYITVENANAMLAKDQLNTLSSAMQKLSAICDLDNSKFDDIDTDKYLCPVKDPSLVLGMNLSTKAPPKKTEEEEETSIHNWAGWSAKK